jgi:hypothetical protein
VLQTVVNHETRQRPQQLRHGLTRQRRLGHACGWLWLGWSGVGGVVGHGA